MIQNVSLSTAALAAVLAGAGGFALGQATRSQSDTTTAKIADNAPNDLGADDTRRDNAGGGDMSGSDLPPDHPAVGNGSDLPPDHPPVNGNANGSATGNASGNGPAAEASLTWTAPPRWKSVPSPNSMRLATYSIPRAPGDSEDAELAITQVGGDVDANVQRWIGQFDPGAKASVKRSTKIVHGMHVTLVQIEGTYSGGMGASQGGKAGYALCGGIVETDTMPYFFKMTGPTKTVHSACSELDAMLGTIAPK